MFDNCHNVERLKLLKYNYDEHHRRSASSGASAGSSSSSSSNSSSSSFDIEAFTAKRYDNVKQFYAYLQRELPNARMFVECQTKKRLQYGLSHFCLFICVTVCELKYCCTYIVQDDTQSPWTWQPCTNASIRWTRASATTASAWVASSIASKRRHVCLRATSSTRCTSIGVCPLALATRVQI